jgi:hypothetical protein
MGTRWRRQRQEEPWYRADLAEAPGHPFYRARKTERAEATAATSSRGQSGIAAKKDDGSRDATGTSGRGCTPIFHSFATTLDDQRFLLASVLIASLRVAPASYSMLAKVRCVKSLI